MPACATACLWQEKCGGILHLIAIHVKMARHRLEVNSHRPSLSSRSNNTAAEIGYRSSVTGLSAAFLRSRRSIYVALLLSTLKPVMLFRTKTSGCPPPSLQHSPNRQPGLLVCAARHQESPHRSRLKWGLCGARLFQRQL